MTFSDMSRRNNKIKTASPNLLLGKYLLKSSIPRSVGVLNENLWDKKLFFAWDFPT